MNPYGHRRRSLCVTFLLIVTLCSMITVPAWSQTSSVDEEQGTASGAGMGAASALSTILYFPFKGAFAIGGGIVGGLAYVFSGGSEQTAMNIWIPSVYGTYVITHDHLTGDRPIRFLGVAHESEYAVAETAPMSDFSPEPVQ